MAWYSPHLSEVGEFWFNIIAGNGIVIASEPAHYEDVEGNIYDVGKVVRAYNKSWLGVAPNYATPAHLMDLLLFLDDFTKLLEEADVKARTQQQGLLSGGTGEVLVDCDELGAWGHPGLEGACRDLQRWRIRLDEYMGAVFEVPPDDEMDRRKTLWSVTAPLFIGWYGGPEGTEPLTPGGFAPGFNPDIRHPADIGTPYSLANLYGIEKAWEKKIREMFIDDITPDIDMDKVKAGLSELKKMLLYTAAGAAGLIVLSTLIRR